MMSVGVQSAGGSNVPGESASEVAPPPAGAGGWWEASVSSHDTLHTAASMSSQHGYWLPPQGATQDGKAETTAPFLGLRSHMPSLTQCYMVTRGDSTRASIRPVRIVEGPRETG